MKNHIMQLPGRSWLLTTPGARRQVIAIWRIIPYMGEMAEDTTNAIEYLNNNRSCLNNKDYKEYVEANSDVSRELASLIAQFVDHGSSKGNVRKTTAEA